LDAAARSLLLSTSGCAWVPPGLGENQFMRIFGIVALFAPRWAAALQARADCPLVQMPPRKFKPLDHIECCYNEGTPGLVIGSAYSVRQIVVATWWLRLFFGKDFWGIRVWGDDNIYHHSHFRSLTRSVTTTDFNMEKSPFGNR
jgi:hypothetical protein